jgi:hypothetical protein
VDQEIDHLIHQDQSPRLHGKEDDDTILWSTGANIHQLCASAHHCHILPTLSWASLWRDWSRKGWWRQQQDSGFCAGKMPQCTLPPLCSSGQVLFHHCYSPNIAYADFVLFSKVKDHLDIITLIYRTPWKAPGNGPLGPSTLKSSPPPTPDS